MTENVENREWEKKKHNSNLGILVRRHLILAWKTKIKSKGDLEKKNFRIKY